MTTPTDDALDRALLRIGETDIEIANAARTELASLRANVEGLRLAIQEIADGAPIEKPDRYDGDNHGDSYSSGYDLAEWSIAEKARAALAEMKER